MNANERPDREGLHAIDAWLDGRADAVSPGWESLAARLETDDAALADFVEHAALHAALRRSITCHAQSRSLETTPSVALRRPADRATPARRPTSWRVVTALAAMLVLAMLAAPLAGWRSGFARPPYATVSRSVGATALVPGTAVRGERLELAAGLVELTTPRGGRIVIEAPAMFRFESPQRLHVTRGRLTADIPATARGFTVVTPAGEAIDLGTRFGVDVPPTGDAEVHVFSGEVVARGVGTTQTSLRDGDAWSLGTASTRDLRSGAFIQRGEVESLAAAVALGRDDVSRAAATRLRAEPDIVAWVDFEGGPGVADGGTMTAGAQCRRVQGRWPGSRAADFTAVGDHVAIDVGGDAAWPQLTLAAWVRLDSLGEPYQSLYHTDGWQADNPGQVHWMLTRAGVMRLALRGLVLEADAVEHDGFPDSHTPVFGTEGRWIHLATVYDSEAHSVRFYLDGRFDSETRLAVAPPATLGPARLGNWNRNDRRLSGRIDEFFILGRALDDDAIGALHAAGNPYGEPAPSGDNTPSGDKTGPPFVRTQADVTGGTAR